MSCLPVMMVAWDRPGGSSAVRGPGAVTRASEDAWQLAARNLAAERRSLMARVQTIVTRLAVPAGEKEGRTAGYATPVERHAKTIRLKALKARLARVERRLAPGEPAPRALPSRTRSGSATVAVSDREGRQRGRPGRERHRDPVHHPPGKRHRDPVHHPPGTGRGFRRLVAGIPAGRFRDRLAQMTANAGLSVVVVNPAYTSRWGAQHWLAPLRQHHPVTTAHHAAALVIGRRGLGHRAGNRAPGNRAAPEDAARPAQARTRNHPAARPAPRKPAALRDTRPPPRRKTGTPHRTTAGTQVPEDRSRAPAEPIVTIARC
jgi:hypothetical protein